MTSARLPANMSEQTIWINSRFICWDGLGRRHGHNLFVSVCANIQHVWVNRGDMERIEAKLTRNN